MPSSPRPPAGPASTSARSAQCRNLLGTPRRRGPGPSPVLRRAARLAVAATLSSAWLDAPDEFTGRSYLIVAAHQTVLDIPAAILVSDALGLRFATWAHPEVLRRARFLRPPGFLPAATDPQGFRTLVQQSREQLRAAPHVALWVFPQGRFSHRNAAVCLQPGVGLLQRACPEVPVLIAGVDYCLFRSPRPHAFIKLAAYQTREASLTDQLVAATGDAAGLAAAQLPQLLTPRFHPRPAPRHSKGTRW